MRTCARFWIVFAVAACALAACRSGAPVPTGPYGGTTSGDHAEDRADGTNGAATAITPREPGTPLAPSVQRKQFKLSPASAALVSQAHAQHKSGNSAVATATLERALRIEPENPLLWLELAQFNQDDGNAAQADSLARKALQLGTADPRVQSSAWQLIAESLRTRGRNQEAAEADRKASAAGSLSER